MDGITKAQTNVWGQCVATLTRALRVVISSWGQRVTLLVLICIIMAFLEPRFFRVLNFQSILLAIAVNGIMSCGMLLTVLVGGMDLSVGSMAGFAASTAFVVTQASGFSAGSFIIGFALAIACCLVVGFLNGFFVTFFGLPAFVVTLAMKYLLLGMTYIVTQGFYVMPPPASLASRVGNQVLLSIPIGDSTFSVPVPAAVFVVVVAITAFVLVKTTYGRQLYAIGGNKNVANLAGIKSDTRVQSAYMISSVMAGIGGVLLASMNSQAGQQTALGYEGNVLMAMVVGGINLAGGEGGVGGAVFGALLVGLINNAMLMLSISSDLQQFVRGVVILAFMTLNIYTVRASKSLMSSGLGKQRDTQD